MLSKQNSVVWLSGLWILRTTLDQILICPGPDDRMMIQESNTTWMHTRRFSPGRLNLMSHWLPLHAHFSQNISELSRMIFGPRSSCLDVFLLAWWVQMYVGMAWQVWTQAGVFEQAWRLALSVQGLGSLSHTHTFFTFSCSLVALHPFVRACISIEGVPNWAESEMLIQ